MTKLQNKVKRGSFEVEKYIFAASKHCRDINTVHLKLSKFIRSILKPITANVSSIADHLLQKQHYKKIE